MGIKQRSTGTFFNLRIKDQAFPVIEQLGKKGDDWEVVASGDFYEGFFVAAKLDTYEYKKETHNKLIMEFHDEDGNKETLSMNFNSLTLNVINTLAGQDSIVGKKIAFTVYSKKDDEGENRPRIYIEVDGQKTEWKYGPDVLKKIHKHQNKWVDMFNKDVLPMIDSPAPKEEDDKTVFDDFNSEQDEKPKAKAPVKSKKEEPKAAAKKKRDPEPEEEEEEEEEDYDDLPF